VAGWSELLIFEDPGFSVVFSLIEGDVACIIECDKNLGRRMQAAGGGMPSHHLDSGLK
jgi:hypothetical protein